MEKIAEVFFFQIKSQKCIYDSEELLEFAEIKCSSE